MPSGAPRLDPIGFLSLREVRGFIRAAWAWPLVVMFGLFYLLGSLLEGGMLGLAHLEGGYTITIITASGTGAGWWNYPALIVGAPWGYLEVPFFTGVSMLIVAAGVALGMAVAVLLLIRLIRPTGAGAARSKAVGAATGLTPAMIGLVTLGACCSTTAAASAGVGLVAQASGTSINNLLLNDWYLGLFQVVVVWAALIAQELLLTVYGGLFGSPASDTGAPTPGPPRLSGAYLLSGALRALLVVGGLLWSLAMFVEWTATSPMTAGAGVWFQWLVQHQLLAGFALAVGFFPRGTLRLLKRARSGISRILPAVLLAAGLSLLVWLPPVLTSAGLDSLFDQVLGAVGVSSVWGAISPGPLGGPALLARWLIEYLAVAGVAVAAALDPERALSPLIGGSYPAPHPPGTDAMAPTPRAGAVPEPGPINAGAAGDP